MMRDFIHAIQFLTRLPTPGAPFRQSGNSSADVPWYALVGLVIGLLLVLFGWVLLLFDLPHNIAAVLLVAVWIAITGALHLDGLADCGDAWMSGKSGAAMQNIMKDTHCGAGAVIWVLLVVALKIAAVGVMMRHGEIAGLLLAPVIARMTVQVAIVKFAYVSPSAPHSAGLGAQLKDNLDQVQALIIAVGLLVILAIVSLPSLVISLIAGVLGFALIFVLVVKKLGGFSGDVYGALIEITESFVLVAVVMTIAP